VATAKKRPPVGIFRLQRKRFFKVCDCRLGVPGIIGVFARPGIIVSGGGAFIPKLAGVFVPNLLENVIRFFILPVLFLKVV